MAVLLQKYLGHLKSGVMALSDLGQQWNAVVISNLQLMAVKEALNEGPAELSLLLGSDKVLLSAHSSGILDLVFARLDSAFSCHVG
jgi:hypothetical protein